MLLVLLVLLVGLVLLVVWILRAARPMPASPIAPAAASALLIVVVAVVAVVVDVLVMLRLVLAKRRAVLRKLRLSLSLTSSTFCLHRRPLATAVRGTLARGPRCTLTPGARRTLRWGSHGSWGSLGSPPARNRRIIATRRLCLRIQRGGRRIARIAVRIRFEASIGWGAVVRARTAAATIRTSTIVHELDATGMMTAACNTNQRTTGRGVSCDLVLVARSPRVARRADLSHTRSSDAIPLPVRKPQDGLRCCSGV